MDHAFISSDAANSPWATRPGGVPATVRMALQPVSDPGAAETYTRLLAHSHYENFSVISVLLPRRLRQDFCNVYAFCRVADDLADEVSDRQKASRLLAGFKEQTHKCYEGQSTTAVFVALAGTIRRHDIPIEPFLDLIDAFEQDQRVDRYETHEQVLDYCRRSANPVGRLVLYMCGHRDEHRQRLSDATCTALQLANFWQDVRRDLLDRDRIYLPLESLRRFNVTEKQLSEGRCDANYRKLIEFEVSRTRELFSEGDQLLPLLDPSVRQQIALFSNGGRAILDSIQRQGYDTLSRRPSLSRLQKGRLIAWALSIYVVGKLTGRAGPAFAPEHARAASISLNRITMPTDFATIPSTSRTAREDAPRIVVVGGGLAGMAATVALESAGASVTLLESRRSLGGRASSFEDPRTGETLDNCQHVLLGCCTNLIDFYRRLKVEHLIRYERTVHFVDPKGRQYRLTGVRGLPAPLHLGPSMSTFNILTLRERVSASRAMISMMRLGKRGRLALAEVSFGQWLDDHGQSRSLVEKFYDPILVGSLNEDCRKAGAAYAIQVFQDAMLAHANGYVIGLPACPLGELYARLPCRDVRLGARVAKIGFTANAATSVDLVNGETIPADAVVLAANYHAVQRWIPENLAATDARFARLDQLQSVPILGAHLWFDKPVLHESHAAFISGPLQWLFKKDSEGKVLHGVISAARSWIDVPRELALKQFEQQIREVFPHAREARLTRGVIVIEKRATFAPTPGVDRLRPPQAPPPGGIHNLYLAGDYTLTGWPATMEGAVRGGYLAATAVLQSMSRQCPTLAPREFLVPHLPIQWPARLLGLEK